MWAASAAFRDLRDDDDENVFLFFDEDNWNWKDLVIAMMTGPLGGLPIIRDVFDGYHGESGPLRMFVEAGASVEDVAESMIVGELGDQDAEWIERRVHKILQGLGPTAGTTSNIFDQIWDITRNFMDND